MLNHDGRVFSSDGKLLGHVKMPGQASSNGNDNNEKKTVQAIAPPPGVKLPPGNYCCITHSYKSLTGSRCPPLSSHRRNINIKW
jgi:hypothetical protein